MTLAEVKESVITFARKKYYLSKNCDYVRANIQRNPHIPFVLSPHGGMLSRIHKAYKDSAKIYDNACMDIEPVRHAELSDVHSIFWCHDSCIGFLGYNAKITVMTLSSYIVYDVQAPSNKRVVKSYPVRDGVAFINEDGDIFVYSSEMKMFDHLGRVSGAHHVISIAASGIYDTVVYIGYEDRRIKKVKDGDEATEEWPLYPQHIVCDSTGEAVFVYNSESSAVNFSSQIQQVNIVPTEAAWVDASTLCVTNGTDAYLIHGTTANSRKLPLTDILFIGSDGKAVKIFTSNQSLTLSVLPRPLDTLFANPHYSSLIECYSLFEMQKMEFHPLLMSILEPLPVLLVQVIEAAPFLPVAAAYSLLKAAAFAKYQLSTFDNDLFAKCLKQTQLMNSLSKTHLAIDFWDVRDEPHAVSALLSQIGQFDLASALCTVTGIDKSDIAFFYTLTSLAKNGEKSVPDILKKVSGIPNVDMLGITKAAFKNRLIDSALYQLASAIRSPLDRLHIIYNLGYKDGLSDTKDGESLYTLLSLYQRDLLPEIFLRTVSENVILAEHYFSYQRLISIEPLIKMTILGNAKCLSLLFLQTIELAEKEKATRSDKEKPFVMEQGLRSIVQRMEKGHPMIPAVENHLSMLSKFKTKEWRTPREAAQNSTDSERSKICKLFNFPVKSEVYIKAEAAISAGSVKDVADIAASVKGAPYCEHVAYKFAHAGFKDQAIVAGAKIQDQQKRLRFYRSCDMPEQSAQLAQKMGEPLTSYEMQLLNK